MATVAVDIPAAASCGAKLLKLGVEGLPVGADAGIADEPFFGMSFGHILREAKPTDSAGSTKIPENLDL
jgi:hypothetical protein